MKKVQQERAAASQVADGRRRRAADRRRTPRLLLNVPVFVYGHSSARRPFHEETQTVLVNANGGLVTLATSVKHGQELLLTNKLTQKEQKCRVVFLRTKDPRKTEVGVAFAQPASDFWR